LQRVILDEQLRIALEAGALEQARSFSWEMTAARTLEIYQSARATMHERVA
jgi:D-inositol-3-phosphate glycosyltransferase